MSPSLASKSASRKTLAGCKGVQVAKNEKDHEFAGCKGVGVA